MSEKQMLELCGTVEDIVFRNKANGYSVLTLYCDGIAATAVGLIPDVSVGDELRLVGNWKNNPTYGEQFSFEYYEHQMPSGSAAILKYLSSRTIKGIGSRMAKKIVDAFGDNTIEIMKNQPERLTEIKGISLEKAKFFSEEINRSFGMKEIFIRLEKYHISALEAVRIWKSFGDTAISAIEENPYVLCGDAVAVPFEKADHIAGVLGKPTDDNFRLRAGISYIISYNAGNGHTCVPIDKLVSASSKFLMIDPEIISSVINEMIEDATLVSAEIHEKAFVFLPSYYKSEFYCADRLGMMLTIPAERLMGGELALQVFEESNGISYADLQRKAILEALSGGLLILTGGPGTGKTTTLNAIIKLYDQFGLKVMLAAPTGRAAQRMTEVTGVEAKTIHRLLEVEWDKNDRPRFTKNERNLLNCDALILDEMSMVDISLFEGVLRALPLGCRLIMVGDSDQLPSVGAGNVLGDLIESGMVPAVRLTEIFRQSMQSLIITNAHRIVHGEMPEIKRTDNDFFFLSEPDKNTIAEKIVSLYTMRLPSAYKYDPLRDIQVLCPGRKGELGVTELNRKLQQAINPPGIGKNELRTPLYILRTGDKVMQTKNNYDLPWVRDDGSEGTGIYNGDIGVIISIDKTSGIAEIRFDDKVVTYNSENLLNIELAYAATVHKSQGSEFRAVIMPMFYGAPQLYYRNLLYTAVTRAKEKIILIGNVSTLRRMVDNNKKTKRYSALKAFLERSAQ